MKLSVVIPVFNSEKSIAALVEVLFAELRAIDFEVILVNDGSKDNSAAICNQLAVNDPRVKFIWLRRNFGEHNAVMCGLNFSSGQYTVIIDDDFQNPPSEILVLLNEIEKGFDVVYSKYRFKKHNFFRNILSRANNSVAGVLIGKPEHLYLSSFKIISCDVVAEIIKYQGPFPYIDGLIMRVTDNISSVYTRHALRSHGTSNYTLKKLFALYSNMFINFSVKPVRAFTITGMLILLAGVLLAACLVTGKVLGLHTPGFAPLLSVILFLSGLEMVFTGLLGEYAAKQYLHQNNTPQYVIKKVHPNSASHKK